MYRLSIILFIVIFVSVGSRRHEEGFKELVEVAKNAPKLFESVFGKKTSEGFPANFICSPFGLLSGLLFVSFGTDGDSTKQIRDLLMLDIEEKQLERVIALLFDKLATNDNTALIISNGLFVKNDTTIKDEFLEIANKAFEAKTQSIDFGATDTRDVINQWVSKETNDRIKELVKELDPSTIAMLLNVVYFKGPWLTPFYPENTRKDIFYGEGGINTTVDFMHTEGTFSLIDKTDSKVKYLYLPYESRKFSLVIILPKEEKDIEAVGWKLFTRLPRKIIRQRRKTHINLSIPKFKIRTRYEEIIPSLQNLGVINIFDSAQADFTRLTTTPGAVISEILQEATIDVNEKGTEATAATLITVVDSALPIPEVIIVNHPFLFAIVHNELEIPIFVGRVSTIPEATKRVKIKKQPYFKWWSY